MNVKSSRFYTCWKFLKRNSQKTFYARALSEAFCVWRMYLSIPSGALVVISDTFRVTRSSHSSKSMRTKRDAKIGVSLSLNFIHTNNKMPMLNEAHYYFTIVKKLFVWGMEARKESRKLLPSSNFVFTLRWYATRYMGTHTCNVRGLIYLCARNIR